jgi:hypothetical protein
VAPLRIAKPRPSPEPTPAEQRLALHLARLVTSGEIHAVRLSLDRHGDLVGQPEAKTIRASDVGASD